MKKTNFARGKITRRGFLHQTALATASLAAARPIARVRAASANDKLNIGIIGVANQGAFSLNNLLSQNIVALCDVDENFLAAAKQKAPQARTYNDFRRLVDQKDLDAIVVATPDHTHAVASMAVLKSGRHLYCEKPLARTISEVRAVTEAARKLRRVTQIGTQIHAGANYRRTVELVQSGAIGAVHEVHVWVNATYGGKERPQDAPPVPKHLHYDLWLGPAEYRPYHPDYLPFVWRHWWAFGGGALADFGCHYIDLPHWALGLRHPATVEIVDAPPLHPESAPPWLIVRYQYLAEHSQPATTLTWYHGGKKPGQDVLPAELAPKWKSGVLFIGNKGMVLADYGRNMLLPEKNFADFVRPAHSIKDSIGHHNEWVAACKTGELPTCNFDYSGPLSEVALLGNVAYRTGKKIEWDHRAMKAKNNSEAEQFIQHHYRQGWSI